MLAGTVRLFTEKEICRKMKPNSFHGVNLPQALIMGRKLKLNLSRSIKLIGIEIKPVASFGDKLSPALNKRLAAICAEAEWILLDSGNAGRIQVIKLAANCVGGGIYAGIRSGKVRCVS